MHVNLKPLLMLGLVTTVLGACSGGSGTEGAAAEGTQFNASQNDQSGAPINVPFSSELYAAPEDGAQISDVVRLEVRGARMENVELLPADGYQPKYGVFNISEDKSIAWLDLDTAKLPDGPVELRISAFDMPAGQPGAQEIIAMPARTWNVDNSAEQGNEPFTASLASAPADGATVSGTVRLEIRGNGIANAELLPATGYSPRFGVFNIAADKTYAWLDFDTRSLPDGERTVRISAFNVMAGQPGAVEEIAMPARTWNFSNGITDTFNATVSMAPAHGALLNGTTRLEVRGSGLENVELLPAYGYEPKLGTFTISSDKTYAYLDVNTEDLPQGVFHARISAFNAPAGSATAREIIAMPARQWETPLADGTPAPGPLTDMNLNNPREIAADANGNLYVVDGESANARIRRIAPDGSISTLRMEEGQDITALAVTPRGDVFYSTTDHWDESDPIEREGMIWRLVDGTPARVTSEELGVVAEMLVDPSNGDLYINNRGEMQRIEQDGSLTTLFPLDAGGVGDMALHKGVLWMHLNYLGREGIISRWTEGGELERPEISGEFTSLGQGMVSTDTGIYLTQASYARPYGYWVSCTVNFLDPEILEMTRIAGTPGERCSYQDEMGQPAPLEFSEITQGSDGNLYVIGINVIRRVTPDGEVTTYAGVPSEAGS